MIESDWAAGGPMAAGPPLLDPSNPDHRDLLSGWLRVQAAFVFRPQDACSALRAGATPAALWRLASNRPAPGLAIIEPGDRSWRALETCGALVLPWTSEAYPARLRRLDDAPPVLLVQGDPDVLRRRCVALVGARAATEAGNRLAQEIARALAGAGICVVSGMARGIDARAHAGALACSGPTIAVQARGPEGVYPPEHTALAAQIRRSGAILTEFPPFTAPRPAHFPLRNRIISGLSEAVVVVEARVRSGSLITARHALDQGVDVMAVPGPVGAAANRGTNELIRDGAAVVLESADVLGALGLDPGAVAWEPAARTGVPDHPLARRVLAVLEDRPASREELAAALACAPETLALVLFELEVAGGIASERDGRFHVCRSA